MKKKKKNGGQLFYTNILVKKTRLLAINVMKSELTFL